MIIEYRIDILECVNDYGDKEYFLNNVLLICNDTKVSKSDWTNPKAISFYGNICIIEGIDEQEFLEDLYQIIELDFIYDFKHWNGKDIILGESTDYYAYGVILCNILNYQYIYTDNEKTFLALTQSNHKGILKQGYQTLDIIGHGNLL